MLSISFSKQKIWQDLSKCDQRVLPMIIWAALWHIANGQQAENKSVFPCNDTSNSKHPSSHFQTIWRSVPRKQECSTMLNLRDCLYHTFITQGTCFTPQNFSISCAMVWVLRISWTRKATIHTRVLNLHWLNSLGTLSFMSSRRTPYSCQF